jgi:hypothetical protein
LEPPFLVLPLVTEKAGAPDESEFTPKECVAR